MKKTSEQYWEHAVELATIIHKLDHMRGMCDFLQKRENDNGDPGYDLEPVLTHAAVALASMVTYADDYRQEDSAEDDPPVAPAKGKGKK